MITAKEARTNYDKFIQSHSLLWEQKLSNILKDIEQHSRDKNYYSIHISLDEEALWLEKELKLRGFKCRHTGTKKDRLIVLSLGIEPNGRDLIIEW